MKVNQFLQFFAILYAKRLSGANMPFSIEDSFKALTVSQFEYAISAQNTFSGKPSAFPLLCTHELFPCVALVAIFDDPFRTAMIAHFSAHATGDVLTHVRESWDAMLSDAGYTGSGLNVSLFGGLRGWDEGSSEHLATCIEQVVRNTKIASLSTNGLFADVRQVAVDCSKGKIYTDDTVNNLFPRNQNDKVATSYFRKLYIHGTTHPSLPLLKHYQDGRTVSLS